MTNEEVEQLFEDNPDVGFFDYEGYCHDCGKETTVTITRKQDGYEITGGAIYRKAVKCQACFDKEPKLKQHCEVYSRIVGYMRPVKQWNEGKQNEFKKRALYDKDLK